MKYKLLIQNILLFFILCFSVFSCENQSSQSPQSLFSGVTMGTTYSINIGSSILPVDRQTFTNEINRRLELVNQQMSTYIDNSTLSKFNQSNAKQSMPIPDELYLVLKEAKRIHQLSHGAFDITVGPLVNLWGFGPSAIPDFVPDDDLIHATLMQTGSDFLHLEDESQSIRKELDGLYLDLSGIAKGYAVDFLAEYLDELNIQNYMVEIGGEIKTKGLNQKNKTWRIGIEKPVIKQRDIQTVIALDNIGMATSGDYRNYFEKDGVRYSHTINPNTGKPINHKLASVTVLHDSAMTADAVATALFVMGEDDGFELAMQEKLAVLFIVREGEDFMTKMTPEFEQTMVSVE